MSQAWPSRQGQSSRQEGQRPRSEPVRLVSECWANKPESQRLLFKGFHSMRLQGGRASADLTTSHSPTGPKAVSCAVLFSNTACSSGIWLYPSPLSSMCSTYCNLCNTLHFTRSAAAVNRSLTGRAQRSGPQVYHCSKCVLMLPVPASE